MILQSEVIYESKYLNVEYIVLDQMFVQTWKEETRTLTEEQYKLTISSWVSLVKKYMPRFVLIDARELLFTIPESLHVWQKDVMFPAVLEAGLTKVAVVMPNDFFAAVFIEIGIDAIRNIRKDEQRLPTEYFKTVEEAYDWLKK